jgi:O-antigen/teichoic acid export membrane protein
MQKKTMSGMLWSFTDLMANQGIQFVIQIILARILLPEHFGLIGMILVFISISNVIIDSGFTSALVREKKPSQQDYSTVFFCNIFIAVIVYGILYIMATPISAFFREPQLILIIRILSLVVVIDSFGIIQRAILTRNVDFRSLTKINIISGICSGILAVVFALLGYGVWSIVIKTLSMQLFQTALLWFFNKWIPTLIFNVHSLKRLFRFSSNVLISSLIGTIYNNILFVVIGRFYSASQLGYYTNAVKLRDVASISITSTVQRVSYPVLSKIQNDNVQLKDNFRNIIKMTTFIIFPIMIGLAAIANPLINLLFGQKWMSSVFYLQLLCLEGMLFPLHAINLNILQVKGRSDLYLLLEIIKRTVMTIMIGLALLFDTGVEGLIIATIIYSVVTLFTNTYFSAREVSYSLINQLKDILPIFLISLLMGTIVYFSGYILPESYTIKLTLQIIIGIFLYVTLCQFANVQEFNTLKRFILMKFVNLKKSRRGQENKL